jgi:gliding motility-associated-like protein
MLKAVTRFILFATLLIGFSITARSTHIIGGFMSYKYIGNDTFEVTLKIYRDCFGGQAPFDNPAFIGIYTGGGNLINTLSVPNPVITNIPPTINNPCLAIPPNICVEEGVYTFKVKLTPRFDGYYIVYQRCCRNGTILNIQNPGAQGASYFARIPPSGVTSTNSSPVFTKFPPILLCNNEPFSADQSAVDPDGDSLAYSFCSPFQGGSQTNPVPNPPLPPPYTNVTYVNPYSPSYPMSALPKLHIDSVTGLITGTPNLLGQFVVGICVNEYRNGILIGTYLRDFQFNVLYCPELALIGPLPDTSKLCRPFVVNFKNHSTNANTYFWNFGDPTTTNDTSSLFEPSWTYPDTGVYNITLYATNVDGCKDTAYASVVIKEAVKAKFTYQKVCPGEPVIFTDNSTSEAGAIISWKWKFGDGDSSAIRNPTHIYSGKGPYNVTLTVLTSDSCEVKLTKSITFHPRPKAKFNFPKACLNTPFTFNDLSSVSSGNIAAWIWDFGDNTANSTVKNPTHTYTNTGTYQVNLIVTSDKGCKDTIVKTIKIDVKPVAAIGNDTSVCKNNPVQLSASGGLFYSWAPAGKVNNPNIANPTATVNTTTTFTVTVSDSCFSDTATVTIEVLPEPKPKFLFIPACQGDTSRFIDQSTDSLGNIISWQWNFGDGGTSTLKDPTHVFIGKGPFTVTLTVENDTGCVKTFTKKIKPFPLPDPDFKLDSVLCLNNPAQFIDLTKTDTGSVVQWSWDFGDNTPKVNVKSPVHTYIAPGTYQVTLIVSNSLGCVDSVKKTFTVNPYPVAVVNSDTAICPGEAVQLNGSGGLFYQWKPGAGLNNPNIANPVATPGTTTTYTLLVSDSCYTDSTQITITVNPAPVTSFTSTQDCVNDTIEFTDQSTTTGGTITQWSWDFGDGSFSSAQNPIHIFGQNGSYTVTLTTTNSFDCSTSFSKTITPYPVADTDFEFDSIPCLQDPTVFTDKSVLVSGNISNWKWYFGDGDSSSTQNPVHVYQLPGTYTVQLITTTGFGCRDTMEKILQIDAFVNAVVSPDTSICSLDVVQLHASGGLYYQWEPSLFANPDTSADPFVSPPVSTTFTVTVADNCSADTATVHINIFDWPTIDVAKDTTIYLGEEAYLKAIAGANVVSYLWEPDSSIVFPSNATDPEITVSPDEVTWYVVTVTDANGCRNRDSAKIDFLDPFIALPNAFTPNGDGLNDIFYVISRGKVELITYRIYNRWGQKIFDISGLAGKNTGWDGTFKGADQPGGSYTYVIKARAVLVGGPIINKSGSVLLIR